MDKQVLLLFSGGRDSLLSACILIEKGYKINLVTFENGVGIMSENATHGAERLLYKYGGEKVSNLGIMNIFGIWREFILPYFNLKPSEIINTYGEITISQFHCLTCRISMYIWSIIKAKQMGIGIIADGARKDQGFVIELPIFIDEIKKMFKIYNIELILPVYDLNSDISRKNELLKRGFAPKTLEPQCLLGVPLPGGKTPEKTIQDGVINYYKQEILNKSKSIIEENKNVVLDNTGVFI